MALFSHLQQMLIEKNSNTTQYWQLLESTPPQTLGILEIDTIVSGPTKTAEVHHPHKSIALWGPSGPYFPLGMGTPGP